MRNDQLLPAGRRPIVTFRLPVVSYLVSTPIWLYRLGRAANWACGSVANADVALAYEFACAFAFRGHICTSSAYEIGIARVELMLAESADKRVEQEIGKVQPHDSFSCATASLYYCFNKRAASRIRHRLGSSQEYQ